MEGLRVRDWAKEKKKERTQGYGQQCGDGGSGGGGCVEVEKGMEE